MQTLANKVSSRYSRPVFSRTMKNSLTIFCAFLSLCSAGAATFAKFVPERKDDFAWENDVVAFRTYGPALRSGAEDSGIDCWLKRTPNLIIEKWYADNARGISYHEDHGEGCDPYHVGSSRGCGGAALWNDGKLVTSDTFKSWKILEQTPDTTTFELTYDYPAIDNLPPIREVKKITITPGSNFFRAESTFTRDGKPVPNLPVAIGVTTHDGKAAASLDPAKRWVSCWETIEGDGLGTAAILTPGQPIETREIKSKDKDQSHALILTRTNPEGKILYFAGYGWARAGKIKSPDQWATTLNAFSDSLNKH